jgi:hypothetical protein
MDDDDASLVEVGFEAEVIYWRGPSPFFFAPVPPEPANRLRGIAAAVTYGWGMIPVAARIGDVAFATSLFPKDGGYLLPLKVAVRRKADITAGDVVAVTLTVQPPERPAPGRWSPV